MCEYHVNIGTYLLCPGSKQSSINLADNFNNIICYL